MHTWLAVDMAACRVDHTARVQVGRVACVAVRRHLHGPEEWRRQTLFSTELSPRSHGCRCRGRAGGTTAQICSSASLLTVHRPGQLMSRCVLIDALLHKMTRETSWAQRSCRRAPTVTLEVQPLSFAAATPRKAKRQRQAVDRTRTERALKRWTTTSERMSDAKGTVSTQW